ncbi:MAG TPA: PQQ-dependent sugar dehydrogenase [Vicinamibacterales bacterium]|nr:PQQ-dependent sugar dehydrogenase [Vicinamibacterales bacterium]
MKRLSFAALALGASALVFTAHAQSKIACDPDNGGITLPQGFCALVVAEDVGVARHMAVAGNGDLYVATQTRGGRGQPQTGGGVVALRDTNGDGKFDQRESIGSGSTTGVGIRNGYLYLAHPTVIERYKMTTGQLKPSGDAEVIVHDLPSEAQHADKGLTFDGKGSLYINVGAPSNACQNPDRRPGVKGQDPCPILEKHGGAWKFDENKMNQTQDAGTKFATGMRQFPAITWHDNALYIVMNNRDQLDVFWPEHFKAEDNANRPAEPMYRATGGENFGWPFCFYDFLQKKEVMNPEYGGDGKEVGRCPSFTQPIAVFPAHWAPVDVMFYTGSQFPSKYKNGAFIAFHGSWNRAPLPQDGYNVVFQPFSGDKPSGNYEVFGTGFAGPNPNQAQYRPDGVAQAPDGSLYIADSNKGKIWRVMVKK